MAALFDNVYARMGKGSAKNSNSPDFRFLEDDEIGQFVHYLEIFSGKGANDEDTGRVRDNYRMINLAACFEPNLLG
jgi:hypothetical protein